MKAPPKAPPAEAELWTPAEVMRALRVGRDRVFSAVKAGRVRSITRSRAGRTCYLIPVEDARREWGIA